MMGAISQHPQEFDAIQLSANRFFTIRCAYELKQFKIFKDFEYC